MNEGSTGPQPPPAPSIILHIPHSSMVIPPDVRSQFVLSDVELHRELLRMTDLFTNELFSLDERIATSVVFDVSRLVVDPERFLDDDQEPMAARGMGCIYSRASTGVPLRQALSAAQRVALLETYYAPHHARLAQAVHVALACNDSVLIIDAHSFASTPLPHESDQRPHRPDICVGTDDFHTPRALVEAAVTLFEAAGYHTALNAPFAGSLVPMDFFREDPRVHSIMIEINRRLYLDESTGLKRAAFEEVRTIITSVIEELTQKNSRS